MGQGSSSRHKTADLSKSESTLEFEPGKKLIHSPRSLDRSAERSLVDKGNFYRSFCCKGYRLNIIILNVRKMYNSSFNGFASINLN